MDKAQLILYGVATYLAIKSLVTLMGQYRQTYKKKLAEELKAAVPPPWLAGAETLQKANVLPNTKVGVPKPAATARPAPVTKTPAKPPVTPTVKPTVTPPVNAAANPAKPEAAAKKAG